MRRAAAAQLRAKLAKADLAAASAVRSCAPRTARFDTSTIRPKPRPLMPGTTAYAASTANHLAQSMLPREELSNVHACGKPSFSDPAWNGCKVPESVIQIRAIRLRAIRELARIAKIGAQRSPQAQLENEGGCRGSAPARRRHRWAYPSAACAASNIRRPSVPPWASSISRSGWGIMPSTLPASLRMPAMARAEPLTGSA